MRTISCEDSRRQLGLQDSPLRARQNFRAAAICSRKCSDDGPTRSAVAQLRTMARSRSATWPLDCRSKTHGLTSTDTVGLRLMGKCRATFCCAASAETLVFWPDATRFDWSLQRPLQGRFQINLRGQRQRRGIGRTRRDGTLCQCGKRHGGEQGNG